MYQDDDKNAHFPQTIGHLEERRLLCTEPKLNVSAHCSIKHYSSSNTRTHTFVIQFEQHLSTNARSCNLNTMSTIVLMISNFVRYCRLNTSSVICPNKYSTTKRRPCRVSPFQPMYICWYQNDFFQSVAPSLFLFIYKLIYMYTHMYICIYVYIGLTPDWYGIWSISYYIIYFYI